MLRIFFALFTALLLILTVPSSAFAGGGPVSLFSFSLRPFDQTQTFILQADTYANESCNAIKPTFSFKDPVDGDSITPFAPPDDGTYITRHYFVTHYPTITWKEICTTYVQAKSGVAKQRTAVVTVSINGKIEVRETPVSFGDDYISKQLQNFGRVNDYDNTPQPDVISEKYLGGSKREVNLHWQKISWAAKYSIFAREANLKDGTTQSDILLTTTPDTQTTINLSSNLDFYISAVACKTDDPCTTNKQDGYSFLLPKMQNTTNTSNDSIPQEIKITPPVSIGVAQPSIIPQPTSADQKIIEDLNQKVASLEAKVTESEKKQNALEATVNNLLSWIRSHFPFFN